LSVSKTVKIELYQKSYKIYIADDGKIVHNETTHMLM